MGCGGRTNIDAMSQLEMEGVKYRLEGVSTKTGVKKNKKNRVKYGQVQHSNIPTFQHRP